MHNERDGYIPEYDSQSQVAVEHWESEGNIPSGQVSITKSLAERLSRSIARSNGLRGVSSALEANVLPQPSRDNGLD